MADDLETLESLDSDEKVEGAESIEELADEKELEEGSEEEVKEEKEEETKEETEEKPEEETTEDEDEEEDEEESDEEEIETPTSGVSVRALKDKYPDIFKENPGLKDVIFKEREYSKIFGTVDDAQEAHEKATTLDAWEKSLIGQGDVGTLLDSIIDTDPDAAVTVATNFLPALFERSRPLFAKVIEPINKALIRNIYTRAMNKGDKQIALACQYIAREIFDTPDVIKATEYQEEKPDPRRDEVRKEREKLEIEQYSSARNDVVENIRGRLRRDILPRLDQKMSEFVKEATVSRILDELDSTLAKDKAHMTHLASLWKRVRSAGFSSEAKSKIISASLARARVVLPAVISKVKATEKGKKVVKKGEETKTVPNQGISKTRQERSPAKLDRNMSDYDFLSK